MCGSAHRRIEHLVGNVGSGVLAGCTGSGYGFLICWSPNQFITLTSSDPTLVTQADIAIGEWQRLMVEVQGLGLPTFGTTTGTADFTISKIGTSSNYCGYTSFTTHTIKLYADTSLAFCNPATAFVGSIATTLKHELAHVLGWSDTPESQGDTDAARYCLLQLPVSLGTHQINTNVCYHDLDVPVRAYAGMLGSLPASASDYWAATFVGMTNVSPKTTTVAVGDSITAAVSLFQPDPQFAAYSSSVSTSWSGVSVSVLQPTKISYHGGGVILGVNDGVGRVKILPNMSLPDTVLLWSGFEVYGDTITVTVTPSTDTNLRVDGIVPDQLPITSAGTHAFVADLHGTQSNEIWVIEWKFHFSDTNTDSTFFAGTTGYYDIHAGSYQVTVKAQPYSFIRGYGFQATQDVPVCTSSEGGGGDDQFRAGGDARKVSRKQNGGGSTNAVEGC